MDDLEISQLTKEIVAERLKQLPDPCAIAADLLKDTLKIALKGMQPAWVAGSRIVDGGCQGCMTALLLNEQNLSRGAVRVVEAVSAAADELGLDRIELMRSALRGLAGMRRFVAPEKIREMAAALEARFPGAGRALEGFCDAPADRAASS